ncbi:MAG: TetR/AcrR family transcriptional regulator [Kitasatospora sp.]|jgi:AcrR family transcriptional regulator|nr:TetR/AcrR family transcriptional regulator [Kitasatospora sp.]
MSAIKGARERARAEITAAIKDEARRRLAEDGAAKLSLRAVARELGMVSSAVYRYYASRDELLTALIIDAYDAVGAATEKAVEAAPPDDPAAAWTAACRAVRRWALDHPHEFTLIHGSPVPGYSAPQDTTGPAARVGLALIAVVRAAYDSGRLREPADDVPGPVADDIRQLLTGLGIEGLPVPVATRLIAAWAQLHGLVAFEVFGQFNGVIEAREPFFDLAAAGLARAVGLEPADRDAAAG